MTTTEYERGYRDGLVLVADIIEGYITKFNLTGDALLHARSIQQGLHAGVLGRDIEGKGEVRRKGENR